MPHPYSTRCAFCGHLTERVQVDLDRRVERLTVERHDGKPVTSVNISQREALHAYCDEACWIAAEPTMVLEFDLRHTYPSFNFVSSCCRCGASVDRTHDYVCLSISTMTYPEAGGTSAACSEDRDWAVLCDVCGHLDGPHSSSVSIDQESFLREFS